MAHTIYQLNIKSLAQLSLVLAVLFFVSISQINLNAQNIDVTNPADSSLGILNLKSKPDSVTVVIENKVRGTTPLQLKLLPGTYQVTLERDGYLKRVDSVEIIKNKITTVDELLLKTPYTNILSTPTGAEVFLDSTFIGRTPIDSLKIPVGYHSVELKMNEYKDITGSLKIIGGYDKTINKTLYPTFGFVSVSVSPKDAEISLDNNRIYTGNISRMKIKTGWHNLSVFHPVLKDTLREKFYIESATFNDFKANFNVFKWRTIVLSSVIPGLGQVCDGSYLKGSLEFLINAGACYFLISSKSKLDDKKWDFLNAQNSYELSANENQAILNRTLMDKAASNYKNAKNVVTVAFAVVGVAYVVNLIDAIVFHSKKNEIYLNKEIIIPVSQLDLFENQGKINFGMHMQF